MPLDGCFQSKRGLAGAHSRRDTRWRTRAPRAGTTVTQGGKPQKLMLLLWELCSWVKLALIRSSMCHSLGGRRQVQSGPHRGPCPQGAHGSGRCCLPCGPRAAFRAEHTPATLRDGTQTPTCGEALYCLRGLLQEVTRHIEEGCPAQPRPMSLSTGGPGEPLPWPGRGVPAADLLDVTVPLGLTVQQH